MRMLDIGGLPPIGLVEDHPVMVISTGQVNAAAKKASADGTYTVGGDGVPRRIRKGDPLPEGAEFNAAKAKPGPTENTQAAGPSETAAAKTPAKKD